MIIKDDEKIVKQPAISVIVTTYNQEKYIAECLDSILSQQCNVPFELIVSDDASADGTGKICADFQKHHPERVIFLQQEKNRGMLDNYADVLELCRGKYVAQCAGDDYWCDPLKLQKQFDCLEKREGFGFVRTAGWRLQSGHLSPSADGEFDLEGDVRSLTNYGPIGLAASVFFERQLLQYVDIRSFKALGITMEDYPMHAIFAHHTKFAYIADRCVVYRATPNSISKNASFDKRISFALGKVEAQRYLRNLYPNELGDVFSDDFLADTAAYLRLRQAIYHFRYAEAKRQKSLIVTEQYKRKKFNRFFRGPISFAVSAVFIRFRD